LSGAGPAGSALILSTTAIGTILDMGTCGIAGRCVGGSANDTACSFDIDCPGGSCATARCLGFCQGTTTPCLTNDNCGAGGICNLGPTGNTKCTGPDTCGASNVCVAVDAAKGFDGVPCTDDDAETAKGVPQTLPQTTNRSSSVVADVLNIAGQQLAHGSCISGNIQPPACLGSVQGVRFNCDSLLSGTPTTAGARLATTFPFPSIDTATTGDGVVTTILTAR
jgi:hypothetical protein